MYENLSTRQQNILDFIIKKINEKGYPPSVREIGAAVGLKSTSTVHGHLNQLEEKGYIKRDPTKPRTIEILGHQKIIDVPLVGKITAGQPILAVENVEETFPLPYNLIQNNDVFMLTVVGDSMIEAGILDGDYVIVRKQSNAKNGDIVAALLGEEATVKRFFKEQGSIRLQPENKYMSPIYCQDVKILGKIVGVFRYVY
ncbi:transcriptional repressor LexA [Bacillota bacterium LX-D]|nr:transcriptional repressor LexA [Bacillota bacterium LX-D]